MSETGFVGLKIDKLIRTRPLINFTSGTMCNLTWSKSMGQLQNSDNPDSAVMMIKKNTGMPSHLKESFVLRTLRPIEVCYTSGGGLNINITRKPNIEQYQLALMPPPEEPEEENSCDETPSPSPPPPPPSGKRRNNILRRVRERACWMRPLKSCPWTSRPRTKPIPVESWTAGVDSTAKMERRSQKTQTEQKNKKRFIR